MNYQTNVVDPDQEFPPRFIAASENHRLDGYFHLCIFLISLRKEGRFSQTGCIIGSSFSKAFLVIQHSLLCALKNVTQYPLSFLATRICRPGLGPPLSSANSEAAVRARATV